MIHNILRCNVRWIRIILSGLLNRRRLEVVRLGLTVLVIIILSVVVVGWCTTRRTLLLISDYRFIDHGNASVATANGH
jgi:hypothetical protein